MSTSVNVHVGRSMCSCRCVYVRVYIRDCLPVECVCVLQLSVVNSCIEAAVIVLQPSH